MRDVGDIVINIGLSKKMIHRIVRYVFSHCQQRCVLPFPTITKNLNFTIIIRCKNYYIVLHTELEMINMVILKRNVIYINIK